MLLSFLTFLAATKERKHEVGRQDRGNGRAEDVKGEDEGKNSNYLLRVEFWRWVACMLIFEMEAWAWAIAKVTIAICLGQLGI